MPDGLWLLACLTSLEAYPTGAIWVGWGDGVSGFLWFKIGLGDGFVWQFFTEGFEAVEFLDGAAVVALGLSLITQQEGEAIGLAGHAMEAIAEQEVAVLGAGDFDVAVAGYGGIHEADGFAGAVEGLVQAGGEEAGFEAGAAEDGVLGEGDAFEGEEFLGVDGLVESDEVVAEMGDFLKVFEADDGEGRAGELVFACILGRPGLALGGSGAGGAGGVGAIGGEALGGDGAMWHKGLPSVLRGSTRRGLGISVRAGKLWGGKGLVFWGIGERKRSARFAGTLEVKGTSRLSPVSGSGHMPSQWRCRRGVLSGAV
jgi:hypothetical protein